MVCDKCGYQNSQGATYCGGCGQKLNEMEKARSKTPKYVLIAVVIMLSMVMGYFTIHDWDNATCTEAATCSICGRTQGNQRHA